MDYKKMWYSIKKELGRNVLYGEEYKKEVRKEILIRMTEIECTEVGIDD